MLFLCSESAKLALSFRHHNCGSNGDVQGAQARFHGDLDGGVGGGVDSFGNAGAFAAENERVIGPKREFDVRNPGFCCEQYQAGVRRANAFKSGPAFMARQVNVLKIIEARATQGSIAHVKAGGTDDIDRDIKAGREPQDRSSILWDIRLVEGETHV